MKGLSAWCLVHNLVVENVDVNSHLKQGHFPLSVRVQMALNGPLLWMSKKKINCIKRLIMTQTNHKITVEDIERIMKDLVRYEPPKQRHFHIMTGTKGMQMIDRALKIEVIIRNLNCAIEKGFIKEDEGERLKEMIHSPDEENLIVAESIYFNLIEQRDTNLKQISCGKHVQYVKV
jgi:hypothetical protein